MHLNESGVDSQVIQNALTSALKKYDHRNSPYFSPYEEEEDIVKFRTLIETSKYFPIDQLQSFSIPAIVKYLKTTSKYLSYIQLIEIQETFHELALNSSSINSDYEEIYDLFCNFKRLLAGQVGVSNKQLYPFSLLAYKAHNKLTEIEEFKNQADSFCLENFIDHHGTDSQILLARVIYLLKGIVPNHKKVTLYKTLIDELAILKRLLYSTFLIEQDVLIPKINRVKRDLSI